MDCYSIETATLTEIIKVLQETTAYITVQDTKTKKFWYLFSLFLVLFVLTTISLCR